LFSKSGAPLELAGPMNTRITDGAGSPDPVLMPTLDHGKECAFVAGEPG
jgi:hypothetical protein